MRTTNSTATAAVSRVLRFAASAAACLACCRPVSANITSVCASFNKAEVDVSNCGTTVPVTLFFGQWHSGTQASAPGTAYVYTPSGKTFSASFAGGCTTSSTVSSAAGALTCANYKTDLVTRWGSGGSCAKTTSFLGKTYPVISAAHDFICFRDGGGGLGTSTEAEVNSGTELAQCAASSSKTYGNFAMTINVDYAAIGKYELLVSGTNMVLDSSTNTGPCSVTKKGRTQRMDITKIVDDLRAKSSYGNPCQKGYGVTKVASCSKGWPSTTASKYCSANWGQEYPARTKEANVSACEAKCDRSAQCLAMSYSKPEGGKCVLCFKSTSTSSHANWQFAVKPAAVKGVTQTKCEQCGQGKHSPVVSGVLPDGACKLTDSPTASPTCPSCTTKAPTSKAPTSKAPTASPTASPTTSPTSTPTVSPTASPSVSPTVSPTASPTTSPTACPPRAYSANGKCTTCPAGRSQPSVNSLKQCPPCEADNTFSKAGALNCSNCDALSFTTGGDATTRTSCKVCRAGYACNGTSITTRCTAGTYAAYGNASCTPCPTGSDSDAFASACEPTMQAVYNTPCDSSDVNFTKDFTRAFKYTAASAFGIAYQRISVKYVLCGSLVVSYIIAPQVDDDPVLGSVPNQVETRSIQADIARAIDTGIIGKMLQVTVNNSATGGITVLPVQSVTVANHKAHGRARAFTASTPSPSKSLNKGRDATVSAIIGVVCVAAMVVAAVSLLCSSSSAKAMP